jgi:uroporphyrinogen decarboxylase
MSDNRLAVLARRAYEDRRRLVAPLMGFPGVEMISSSIKTAQQNYGIHYRAVRALVEAFQPDLAFPLMDLSVEANALGRFVVFPKDESATVPKDTFHIDELERLAQINISFDGRLNGYIETMKLMSIGLPDNVLRGAYVAGPYSLAALLLGADEAAMLALADPAVLHTLCEFVTERIQEYVRLFISAGAEVICVLEPSAVMLGPDQFEQFSAQYVRHITTSCRFSGVATVYHTCGNTMHVIEKMAGAGVGGVSLDAAKMGVDLAEAARRVPEDVVVIGNICPATTMLTGTAREVEDETRALLRKMDPYPNFILSTGCDLPQETPLENIHAFMRTGREHRVGG